MPKKARRVPAPLANLDTPKKIPDYLGRPNLESKHMAWRFSSSDTSGPFDCANLSHDDFNKLWDRLREFETKNPSELRATGSFHAIPIQDFSKEARDRLVDRQLDDFEELYSFRIDAKCRIYCMKWENIFSILWWDSEHKAYPVEKSNT